MFHRRLLSQLATVLAGVIIAVTAQGQELKIPSPIGLLAKVYFEDRFEGNQLANHWQVTNPDPDGYIVEDGALLLITKAVGGLDNETTPNLFRLKKELPAGDWIITVKLKAEFQTGREMLQFGLFSGPTSYIATNFFSNNWDYGRNSNLTIRTQKKSGEKVTKFEKQAWGERLTFEPFAATIPQPITLKLTKEGRTYRSAVHFDGQKSESGEPIWIETELVASLRAPKELVLNASQWEKVAGESLFLIDSVTIETAANK